MLRHAVADDTTKYEFYIRINRNWFLMVRNRCRGASPSEFLLRLGALRFAHDGDT